MKGRGRLILPLSVLLLVSCTCAINRQGFLLTAPKLLWSGTEETMCLTFHELEEDVFVTVSLAEESTIVHSQEFVFKDGGSGCVEFQVPSGLEQEELALVVEGSSGSYNFSERTQIGIGAEKTLTYIQTDKPLYKPGQTVNFRVLVLDSDLKPRDIQVKQVIVLDPSGSRIMQWDAQESRNGLLSLDLPLSEEPVMGTWKIRVKILDSEQEQAFKVEEYVLPKFEVTVKMPSYVLVNETVLHAEVCARYTYGKPVKGDLNVFAVIKQPYYGQRKRPDSIQKLSINGCQSVKINTAELMMDSVRWSLWDAKVHVSATVEEQATGISMIGNSTITSIKRDPLQIDLKSGSPEYFKPGLPFYGKVKVTKPDGMPAPGELIHLSMQNYRLKKNLEMRYVTDANGEFIYTLPPMEKDIVSISINARAPLYDVSPVKSRQRLYLPSSHHSVKQWFSASGSFVQMDPIEQVVTCNSAITVNVSYTTTDESTHTFYYQLMSRGNILLSGSRLSHFNRTESSIRRKRSSMPMLPYPPEDDDNVPETPILDYTASFQFDIDIKPEMSPNAKLLVYYLHDNGEVVADSIEIKVSKCFSNRVSMDFGAESLYPGETVSLGISADAGSVCALNVVDKSVHLLGGNNQLDINKVFDSMKGLDLSEDSPPHFRSDHCHNQMSKDGTGFGPPRLPGISGPPGARRNGAFRAKRQAYGYPYSKYFDSSHAFKQYGALAVSDMVLDSRPCERELYVLKVFHPIQQVALPAPGAKQGPAGSSGQITKSTSVLDSSPPEAKPSKKVVDMRNYFPETWIWKVVDLGASGQRTLSEKLPHSITEWIGSAMCTNTETGLGISAPTHLKGFQPFFASFTLPYSVIRGEKVPVILTVFNYLSDCLVVELTLKKDTTFRIASDSRKSRICVCGSEAASHTFHIVPTEIDKINITVTALSVKSDKVCGNGAKMSSDIGARDAVTRSLIVEAEGREEEYSKSSFICPDDKIYSEMIDLNIPANVIEDSARGYITAIGDVMGPSLSGLDSLLKLPTGCGEQNMIKFAPNIYVLQYLSETNQAAPKIRKMALDYMKTGYQRELTYRHNDGSYSAFGSRDDEGSMWLTAFVVKSFAQAESFIYIDHEDLDKSISWFKSKQLENGCFPQVGKVLHKGMKGGLADGENPTASLTAYVLVAMLSAGVGRTDRAVEDALLCLRSQTITDTYTLALMAYAYTLYDPNLPERIQLLSQLDQMAIREGALTHWEAPRDNSTEENALFYHLPKSADVELTAYILLAHLLGDGENTIATALPIVRWVTAQRNAHGGFASTQDTVVALQALARFASITYGLGSDIRMRILGRDFQHEFDINDDNKFVLYSRKINVSNALSLQVTGKGCAFFQANVKYNMPLEEKTPQPAFDVKIMIPSFGVGRGKDACKKRKISVCSRYTRSDGASNMAIVAVKMVSGWVPIKDSIYRLKEDRDLGIKRVEIDHKWVNFYFDELTASLSCVQFEIEQDMEIDHAKPAFVHVYDYYKPELSVKEKYKIRRVCGTKLELPVLTREEYDKIKHTEQARVPIELPEFGLKTDEGLNLPAEEVCPVCLTEEPMDLISRFCLSRHAYKAEVRPRGRFPLKFLLDMRLSTRENIHRYTNFTLSPVCEPCGLLSRKGGMKKILILTKETSLVRLSETHGTINFQNDVTLVPMNNVRQMHRRLRKTLKSGTCDK